MSIGAAVAGAVVSVGGAIIGGVLGIGAAIGGTILSIGAAIGTTVLSIASAIGTTVLSIASAILSTIGNLAAWTFNTVVNLAVGLTEAIGSLSAGLTEAIKAITLPVTKMITDATGAIVSVVDPVATAILTPIKDTLVIVKGAVDMITGPVNALLEPVIAARELIGAVSSLKILYDVLRGQAEIAELLGAIGDGEAAKTAEAIAILYRDITSTTVGMIDKVDTETEMLWTSIDKFDERIKTSVAEGVELTKAEVMAMVTPRLDTIGVGQAKMTGEIARLSRHLEDVPWFSWMFLRMLR